MRHRVVREAVAVALLLGALLIAVALVSHSPLDPSPFHASTVSTFLGAATVAGGAAQAANPLACHLGRITSFHIGFNASTIFTPPSRLPTRNGSPL